MRYVGNRFVCLYLYIGVCQVVIMMELCIRRGRLVL